MDLLVTLLSGHQVPLVIEDPRPGETPQGVILALVCPGGGSGGWWVDTFGNAVHRDSVAAITPRVP